MTITTATRKTLTEAVVTVVTATGTITAAVVATIQDDVAVRRQDLRKDLDGREVRREIVTGDGAEAGVGADLQGREADVAIDTTVVRRHRVITDAHHRQTSGAAANKSQRPRSDMTTEQ